MHGCAGRWLRRVGTWALLAGVGLTAAGARAQPAEAADGVCFPPCREGYVCDPRTSACVSACNPPCVADERCTATAQCVPVPTATPAPAPAALAHPDVAALLRVGATFGSLGGGTVGFGVAIRLAPSALLDLEVRGAGGVRGGSTFALGGGELTLRVAPPRRVGWMARGGLGVAFLAEYQTFSATGYDYAYRVTYGRLSGGAHFKLEGRPALGVELALALGSAVETENYVDFEDHGGLYGEASVLGMLTF